MDIGQDRQREKDYQYCALYRLMHAGESIFYEVDLCLFSKISHTVS